MQKSKFFFHVFSIMMAESDRSFCTHSMVITLRNPSMWGTRSQDLVPTWTGGTRVCLVYACPVGRAILKRPLAWFTPASACCHVQKYLGWISRLFTIAFSMGWAIPLKNLDLTSLPVYLTKVKAYEHFYSTRSNRYFEKSPQIKKPSFLKSLN